MTDQPENPPAFPSHAGDPEMTDPRNRISCGGMSLRDFFAAAALPALIPIGRTEGWMDKHISEAAYVYADAMLRERGK